MAGAGLHRQGDLASYREYHARRSRERLERREAHRQSSLEAARAGIRQLAPAFAPIRAVYLFGSLLQPEQFSRRSDVAVECDDPAIEGRFRRELEEELRQNIDLRPLEAGWRGPSSSTGSAFMSEKFLVLERSVRDDLEVEKEAELDRRLDALEREGPVGISSDELFARIQQLSS